MADLSDEAPSKNFIDATKIKTLLNFYFEQMLGGEEVAKEYQKVQAERQQDEWWRRKQLGERAPGGALHSPPMEDIFKLITYNMLAQERGNKTPTLTPKFKR